jgi:hypothetical protein
MNRSFAQPVRFDPTLERLEEDEAETTAKLIETLRDIGEKTLEDNGRASRSVHAKSHGLLLAELAVMDGLPPALAQGLFSTPSTYDVVMRLSTVPGDLLDDSVSTPRGLAIKVLGAPGDRLPGSADASTQDFVMVNGPVFLKPDAKSFLCGLRLLAKTTDRVPRLKKALSAVLRGTEKTIEAFGGESASIKALGGHPRTNILGETFFTQVPIRYGDYMAKLSVAPVSAQLAALRDAPLDLNGEPDGLRAAVVRHFATMGGEWELRAQLCTDLETMPIEDASVEWPEEVSPYIPVARITARPQQAWAEPRSSALDQRLSFTPWHGILAHQPLGSVMRVRKAVYDAMSRFRAEKNGVSLTEPRDLDDLAI